MFSKIKALTKIFVKDFYQSTKIVDKETKKLNKKSIYLWILVLLGIAMIYISYKAIHWFVLAEQPELFINIYVPLLIIFLMFQIAIICTNIFFFSKDIEFILPLPVSSKELLISKFNVILLMTYITEMLFGIPLILYGFLNFTSFWYFFNLILVLILLPIVFVAIIGLIAVIFMRLFNFIKNKIMLQNIISIILIICLLFIEDSLISNFSNLQQPSIFITPIINLLIEKDIFIKIKSSFVLFSIDILSLFIFVFISKKIYLKIILNSITSTKRKLKRVEKKKVKIENKNSKIWKSYIKKEMKMLLKKPVFFMQTVFPVVMILVTMIMIANIFIPAIDTAIENDETIKVGLASLEFNSEMICVILGILQCLFSLSSISLTAISREGKNAIFMKYIPVSYYKQFLYKNVLQVVLNIIVSLIILFIIYYYIPKIGLLNILLIFIISIFINLINSYLMLLIDLKRPYLNWTSEHSVVKKNDNKSFQYALTIILILVYMYLSNIFKNVNVIITLIIEIFIFMITFIIIDRIVKKKSNQLFNNIN